MGESVHRPALVFAAFSCSFLLSACGPVATPIAPTSPSASALAADVDTLASPAFGGREAGTPGADSAADLIARRYQKLGLRPAFKIACDSMGQCRPSYLQPFQITNGTGHNVGAVVDGVDSARRSEFVVIGAHFDHLGHSPSFAMDRDAGFVLRPGADDNASGTAAVLELSRRFAARPARRSILFVNFDAEEEGFVGSRVLLRQPPVPAAAMSFMLNLDMVGRMRGDHLVVESGRMDRSTRAIFDSAAKAAGIRPDFVPSEGRSDHDSFEAQDIAAAELYTGMHPDYHTASDVAGRINVEGLARVVDFAELVARRTADR